VQSIERFQILLKGLRILLIKHTSLRSIVGVTATVAGLKKVINLSADLQDAMIDVGRLLILKVQKK
jgi:hypothetical protein